MTLQKKIGEFAKHNNAFERVNEDLRSKIESPSNSISQQREIVNIGFNEDRNASFNPVADKEKGIVYRWVNGEKWFYQVYNRDLLGALSSLDVEQLTKGWRFVNTMSNVLKRTMTMWNPIFFTGNAIKDFQSFKKNTVTNAGVLGSLGMYISSAKSTESPEKSKRYTLCITVTSLPFVRDAGTSLTLSINRSAAGAASR